MPNGKDITTEEQQEFLNWLAETYNLDWTWLQAPAVLWRYRKSALTNDPHYQYWAKYVKKVEPAPTPQWDATMEAEAEKALSQATPEQAEELLRGWAKNAPMLGISQEQLDAYWKTYVAPSKFDMDRALKELEGATVKEAERIMQGWIDEGLVNQEQVDYAGKWYFQDKKNKLEQAYWGLGRYPETKELLKGVSPDEEGAYLEGKSNDLLDKLSGFYEQANVVRREEWGKGVEERRASVKEAQEAQRAQAALGGIAELGRVPPKEKFVRPALPEAEEITKPFVEETGLGKGTRLMSFLEGEFIPEILKETKGAREEWWRKMHPEPEGGKDIEGQIAQLQEEARRWAGLAWGSRAAPETDVSGGVFYGPGGLRNVAEQAYRGALRQLGERMSEQEMGRGGDGGGEHPEPLRPGPDPLIAALRKKKYMPEYYRGAGTGLVSRLTPAIRY